MIIVTGSKQGITCPPGNAAYNVSKAGVKAFAEQLGYEVHAKTDLVSTHLLVPGWVHSKVGALCFDIIGFARMLMDPIDS